MKENRQMVEQLFIDTIYRLKDESIIIQCKERMMAGHQQSNVFLTSGLFHGRLSIGFEMKVGGSVWILVSQRVIRGGVGIREDTS
ncbi:hypothetical protein TNCV_528481 [Trichonephila clavipes]|nr:hypothetical protein TNCV_528481 [Trichonephila clavipes]